MLIVKERKESKELLLFKSLHPRKCLFEKEKQYYLSLEKGYEGEVEFDHWIRGFSGGWLFLNDLLLGHNNTFFQIDSLGLTHDDVYLFEIKNYEGDFVVKGDTWQSTAGKEIKNPLHQLKRCESSLKRFLQDRGLHFNIKTFLIFVNPFFTLYQAPVNPSIIFPSQLNHFFSNLSKISRPVGAKQTKLTEILIAAHKETYPNPFIPDYEYDELAKGILCEKCRSFMRFAGDKRKMICAHCAASEELEFAIMRNVAEFRTLFPERKVTTIGMHDWCGGIFSTKTIQRVLARNFAYAMQGRATHYVEKEAMSIEI